MQTIRKDTRHGINGKNNSIEQPVYTKCLVCSASGGIWTMLIYASSILCARTYKQLTSKLCSCVSNVAVLCQKFMKVYYTAEQSSVHLLGVLMKSDIIRILSPFCLYFIRISNLICCKSK